MSMIRLNQLLNKAQSSRLDKLVQRAQDMGELTQILQTELPPELAEQLLAANLREDGELVLVCASQCFAARLRFETGNLTKAAIAAGAAVESCRVSVTRE